MRINIELDELIQCNSCGIVFNMYFVKKENRNLFKGDTDKYYICPLCKKEIEVEE